MPQQITVRVELGPYTLVGREVEALTVRQAVGAHAQCLLHFMRDPNAASPLASLRLAELAGAGLRVAFLVDPSADGGGSECLAFEGTVREAEIEHLATGAGEVTVMALSNSYLLAEHADRRYFREQTVATLAERLGVRVAGGPPAGAPRDYVQAGVSDWAFFAEVAAEEGLQFRARWPRTPEGAADFHAEVGRGFADEAHALTWGRELQRFATVLAPTNAGVTGAFYDPAAKHDHRFRGVRAPVEWLGGATPVVAKAREVSTTDADGGDPGHVEPGRLGGTRARTLTEFRDRLQLESARRLGGAVRARGTSVLPALRAGDRIEVLAAQGLQIGKSSEGDVAGGATPDGEGSSADAASGGAPGRGGSGADAGGEGELDDRTGTFGLVAVTHRWAGTLYQNEFEATPWAGYHRAPEAAGGPLGGGAARDALALAVVTANDDPKGRGRVRVRYPWMDAGEATAWVRVAGLGGGNGRGLGVLPEVGDEVVVAAVGGDPEHPVVLGTLWNAVDKAGHGPGRQLWRTKSGSMLDLSEGPRAGQQTIKLCTPGGGAMVRLDASGPLVTIHSEGDLAIEAPNGELRIHAKSMTTHVDADAARVVEGKADDHVTGPITVESKAHVGVKGKTTAVVSDEAMAIHAGRPLTVSSGAAITVRAAGPHTTVAPTIALNP